MGMGMLGALGGLGEAGVGVGKQLMQDALEKDKIDYLTQKQMAVKEAELKLAQQFKDQERQGQVDRIDSARAGIIDTALGQKYAASDAAVADADAGRTDMPLTQEQKGVIAQSKAADEAKLRNDMKVMAQAALNAGEYAVGERLAAIAQRGDVETLRNEMRLQELARKVEHDKDWVEVKKELLENQQRGQDMRYGEGASGPGRSGGKVDHFDDKAWADTVKGYDRFFVSKDEVTGAERLDAVGKSAFRRMVAANRMSGVSPEDAADNAVQAIDAIKSKSTANGRFDPEAYKRNLAALFQGDRTSTAESTKTAPATDTPKPTGMLSTASESAPVARDWGFDPAAFDIVLEAASRGGAQHKEQLRYWLDSGDLTRGQMERARRALK